MYLRDSVNQNEYTSSHAKDDAGLSYHLFHCHAWLSLAHSLPSPLGKWIKSWDRSVTPPLGSSTDDDSLNNPISLESHGRFCVGILTKQNLRRSNPWSANCFYLNQRHHHHTFLCNISSNFQNLKFKFSPVFTFRFHFFNVR